MIQKSNQKYFKKLSSKPNDMKKRKIIIIALLSGFFLNSTMFACGKKDEEIGRTEEEEKSPEKQEESESTSFTLPMAIFTEPEKLSEGKASTAIMDKLVECVDAAVKNSVIHVSIYLFNYMPLRAALANAHNRNIQVNVIVDHSKESSQSSNYETIKFLDPILKGNSKLIQFNNDVSSTAINHHKYVLFSEIKLKDNVYKNVVFSTSANFTVRETKFLEDAVILSHSGLYAAAKRNWEVMEEKTPTGMKYFEYDEFKDPEGNLEAHFFPRRHEGTWDERHTIMELLNDYTEGLKNITVRIGMSMWSDANVMIVDKLLSLQKEGARIEVISRATDNVGEKVKEKLSELKSKGGYVLLLKEPGLIHSKFTLIEGVRDGKEETYVMNGTLNFINPELKNNNNLLLILKNNEMYLDYVDNFNKIKASRK